jgi:hypothetical protein
MEIAVNVEASKSTFYKKIFEKLVPASRQANPACMNSTVDPVIIRNRES